MKRLKMSRNSWACPPKNKMKTLALMLEESDAKTGKVNAARWCC